MRNIIMDWGSAAIAATDFAEIMGGHQLEGDYDKTNLKEVITRARNGLHHSPLRQQPNPLAYATSVDKGFNQLCTGAA